MKKFISVEIEVVNFLAQDIVTVSDSNGLFSGSQAGDKDFGDFGSWS